MIKILLFAQLQEETSTDKLFVKTDNWTIKQVKEHLEKQYPGLMLQSVMTAVNEEYSFDDQIVKDGDTVAFLPPVSGG